MSPMELLCTAAIADSLEDTPAENRSIKMAILIRLLRLSLGLILSTFQYYFLGSRKDLPFDQEKRKRIPFSQHKQIIIHLKDN